MRLCFTNKEIDDVLIAPGDTTLGAAADNVIVLDKPGVAAHHARLDVSERSTVLTVCDAQASTHVNARPVREKALLHLGDIVSLDAVQFMLKPDRDDSISSTLPTQTSPLPTPMPVAEPAGAGAHQAPPKLVLRGVSGSYFGKIVPVRGRLAIGRGSDCDLVLDEAEMARQHAVIEIVGDAVYLRDMGSANGTFVNGVQVRDAVLYPDDQIAFDRNRFLLEAPSLPTRPDGTSDVMHERANITQTMRAIPQASAPNADAAAAEAQDNDRNRNDIWWLIGAAALIGLGIAMLLFVRL